MKHDIILPDCIIPIRDYSLIHHFHILKRSVAETNDIPMIKMGIGAGGNLAASNIRNLECPSYEVYLIDYGCGKFNKKVHIME